MSAQHAAVKHELLVRYLDAWTPAVLHGHKRVTYVEWHADPGGSAVAAARVFGEFADLLDRHELTMLLIGADPAAAGALAERLVSVIAEYGAPAGLQVSTATGPVVKALKSALGSPIFAWFDSYGNDGPPLDAVTAVAGNKASEVLLALPAGVAGLYLDAATAAGLALTCRVELVDNAGAAELLLFATSAEKNLEKFKDELWALDEYAGIRLRDPTDAERTLLDISVQPHLGPLRRALAARVMVTGGATLAELRSWAVHETVFRSADATKAVQALVLAGTVSREPAGGRLSPATMIRPAGS